MNLFIKKNLIFLILLPFLIYLLSVFLVYSNVYKKIATNSLIYQALDKSRKKQIAKKIILGDSVGEQLFSCYSESDTLLSLATNASINMVGQYLLLNNYLNAGNKIEQVYLIYNPLGFKNNMEGHITYHFFLKPFYRDEYKPLFSKTVLTQLNKIPFISICQNPLVLSSDWVPPKRNYPINETNDTVFLSPISIEYLHRIKKLSIIHNFKFKIISPPVIISNKQKINKLDKQSINSSNLTEEFKDYFEQIIYLNDSCFMDEFHLNNPKVYSESFKNKFIL